MRLLLNRLPLFRTSYGSISQPLDICSLIVRKIRHPEAFACLLCCLTVPLLASVNNPATFIVGQTVVHSNLPGFGAEYAMELRVNNWIDNSGFEPLVIQRYWELTGGGSDATGVFALCNTRYYDTLSSGFLDGGYYRLYREVTNAAGDGWIEKIREGVVPDGGFIAAGYEEIGLAAVRGIPPATDAVDNYYLVNGQPYYYAVRARDVSGNWSDFSALIDAATPHSLSNNDPRIVTAQIPNPTVGQNYSSTPLVTMNAAGGIAPLTWSIISGSLPPQLVLLPNGQITGRCPAAVESTVTIQVQDAAARTHARQYRIFGSAPSAVAGNPAPPSNVRAQAFNGYVHIWWDPSPSSDVTEYRVYRSRFPASAHRECIYLGTNGPLPQSGDLLFVEKKTIHTPPPQTVSIRVLGLQGEGTVWKREGHASTTQEIVTIPGPIPAQMLAEHCGTSCLRITCAAAAEFGVSRYTYSWTNDPWWGATMLLTGRTYRIECWVRGEGLPPAHTNICFRLPGYFDRRVTGIVNGAWVKLGAEFSVTNWLTTSMSTAGPNFLFTGPGTVYLDNAVLYDVTDGSGVGDYHRYVHGLWRDYVGASNAPFKGALRYRWHEDPFEYVVQPAVMTPRRWDVDTGARDCQPMHLHAMLDAAYASGDTPSSRPIPWITANLHWKEDDFVKLIEFLAAPATVGYGAVRATQRGTPTPWVDEFRGIYIEMGNEPWNGGYFFSFRGGFSATSGRTYGRWCQYISDYVASNTVYWTNSIKIVLGGWNAGAGVQQFSGQARLACPSASHVGFASYLGGWEAGQGGQIGGTTWSDEGVQLWTTFLDHSGRKWADAITGLQRAMTQTGLPFEIVCYEGGPSYLKSGLNNITLTPQQQEVSRTYGRTLAAGIGCLDFWLYATLRGVREQAFFSFFEDKDLWASHTLACFNFRPHPSWLALLLANKVLGGSSMLATYAEILPYGHLRDTNGVITVSNATFAAVYAFKRDHSYAVLLLNKKVNGVHSGHNFGDGSVPVTVRVPFTSPRQITLYKLSGDPRLTNRQQMNVPVVTQDIPTTYFSKNFTVDHYTGGTTNGLPVGAVYLYVFDDVIEDTLSAAPQVTINQAATQADPHDGSANPIVYFTAVFDRPVTGFTNPATAVLLSGTAEPQTATIVPEPGSAETIYTIAVSGMRRPGTVRVDIPAGAAFALADGTPCSASTSTDNVVTVVFPRGLVLAEWEFADDPGTNFFQNPAATAFHPFLIPSVLSVGPGVVVSDNRYYNDDGFGCTDLHAPAQDPNDYIAWAVSPTAGWAVTITGLRLGVFTQTSGDDVFLALHWSTNNFVTSAALPLSTNVIYGRGLARTAGTIVEADTRTIAALSNTPHTVQFRLYLWGTAGYANGTGIGKLGSAVPDLVILGLMHPRVPYITEHPQDRVVQLFAATTFQVDHDGAPPFFYQWYHNHEPIANATALVYEIASAQFLHSGTYFIVVSNNYGVATSKSAELRVIPEPVLRLGVLWASVLCARRRCRRSP